MWEIFIAQAIPELTIVGWGEPLFNHHSYIALDFLQKILQFLEEVLGGTRFSTPLGPKSG